MTEHVFDKAKLDSLTKENEQLKATLSFYTNNLKAQKFSLDEYMTKTINLHAAALGLEDQVKFHATQVQSLTERVKALESEKVELVKKLEIAFNEKEPLKLVNE